MISSPGWTIRSAHARPPRKQPADLRDPAIAATLDRYSEPPLPLNGSASILLVDSLTTMRTALAYMLHDQADLFVVGQVGTIAAARHVITSPEVRVDLVVSALNLPDGHPADLIPLLRDYQPHARVVALTAYTDRNLHADAIARGLSGVILKTDSAESVIETLRCVSQGGPVHPADELIELLRLGATTRTEPELNAAFARLTERELQVLQTLGDGHSDKEIARALDISTYTVAAHINHIRRKLGVQNRLQAVLLAIKHGVVEVR